LRQQPELGRVNLLTTLRKRERQYSWGERGAAMNGAATVSGTTTSGTTIVEQP
jgi:hypothetical protein